MCKSVLATLCICQRRLFSRLKRYYLYRSILDRCRQQYLLEATFQPIETQCQFFIQFLYLKMYLLEATFQPIETLYSESMWSYLTRSPNSICQRRLFSRLKLFFSCVRHVCRVHLICICQRRLFSRLKLWYLKLFFTASSADDIGICQRRFFSRLKHLSPILMGGKVGQSYLLEAIFQPIETNLNQRLQPHG